MAKSEKYFNILLIIFSSLIGIFILNFLVDYLIYQKGYESKYYKKISNFNSKLEEINNTDEIIMPNIGSLITNNKLTKIIKKENKIIFGNVPNSKIILCNEDGEYVYFNSDKFGFRNKNINYNKQIFKNGEMPILIGDSFGLGVCIEDKIYLKDIKDKVINLSVSGSGPISQIALINEYLINFKTNKIIWLYYEGNDLLDLEIEMKNLVFKNYLESIDNWPIYNYFENINDTELFLVNYIKNLKKGKFIEGTSFKEIRYGKDFSLSRLIKLTAIRNIFRNYKNTNNYGQSKKLNKYLDSFNELNRVLLKNNIDVKFIFLPSYKTVARGKISRSIQDLKKVLEINFENVEVHNFDEYIIKRLPKEKIYINPKSHFSHDAYRELYSYIKNII